MGMGKKRQEKERSVPKGCLAIKVGQEGEKQERFVVPLIYFNHPLFMQLLKHAEDEYGFHHNGGTITIPCHVQHFRHVQGIIHRDSLSNHRNSPRCFGFS
ncbi:hypothetical protein HN51_014418 [Arachis hypogaea]|uniref:Auxin-induced protein n=1 Tax=Arachis hypogaea TaxID=3818 RepID=A0A445CPQ0_ARAHY|nr:Auxin-responsive protein [Arachis hypogaea]RYR52853.1 hypothetical protein Ahy_A06g027722 [Arachis hypogaea]